ncbi:tetraacyldisaccharide 4'-kinase [Pseudoalteromonas phenolica]|uniref:Tetraacyldisaccharide 4'-kinase n=1 Tax=Pseudoalteromonas phenolica TaxID=161398 RepID=A0A0S2K1J5_9GAMM|nr:tetraacyldisaccharide 4'-kinase [Pseudoalteromonas phenolica]ALO42272.1 Tetraacyldisaccharide 4'-kinase [Pseudoalteromonas phenolica]MBE0356635.1 tetraacyldisaccharide 4'-kinase [Pseudoalteromonas phenolica O-BC30]
MSYIESSWYKKRSTITWLLAPLSGLFFLLSSFRKLLFKLRVIKSFKVEIPIIVVGNISIGGNGKTPFVLWLVPHLESKGLKVGVISRGYGAKAPVYPYELTSTSTVEEAGDEPFLIYNRLQCPLVIGADREASYRILKEKYKVDVIVSDDGMQHYKMPRAIEFCIVDSKRRFGNGFLIPAGPLRELPSRIKSVDLAIENGGDSLFSYQLSSSGFYRVENKEFAEDSPNEGIAVSAIGSPQRFEKSLEVLGKKLVDRKHFRDHHAYTEQDFTGTESQAVFMTEKDAVKCQQFAKNNWYYLKVDATPTKELIVKIDQLLKQKGITHGI